jgi:hypothetical protein
MLLLNQSNMAHTRDGPVRRQVKTTAIIVGAASALLASVHTFADANEASTRMAREHYACAVVMGLRQPGELYDTCVRSLDNSLSQLDQSRLVSTDRRRCAKERLKPGTPAFADCVVDADKPQPVLAGNGQVAATVEATRNIRRSEKKCRAST